MTPRLDVVALLPELTLVTAIVVVLIADLFVSTTHRRFLSLLGLIGAAAPTVAAAVLLSAHRHAVLISGTYVVDDFSLLAKSLLCGVAVLVLLMGLPEQWPGEYVVLLLSSLLGMVIIVSARDLITFFVAFELLSIPGYLLVGWRKRSPYGHEGALKYYLLGVLTAAVMLYGLSLLFGLAGGTSFHAVALSLSGGGDQIPLARLALLFVVAGAAFKISAVPFQFWAPDAYQAAPIPVAAFLSVASKAAGLLALIELISVAFQDASSVWAPLLWAMSILSMTLGNLVALRQTDALRLLAYSSISQAGYLLIPLAVAGHSADNNASVISTSFVYLLIYAATNLGAFSAVLAATRYTGSTALACFSGLFQRAPAVAVTFTISLMSLAGLPPFGGWYAKFVVFRAAIDAHCFMGTSLAIVAAVNSAIGLVYYATVVRRLWPVNSNSQEVSMEPGQNPARLSQPADTFVIDKPAMAVPLVTTVLIVGSGVMPGVVAHLGGMSSLIS